MCHPLQGIYNHLFFSARTSLLVKSVCLSKICFSQVVAELLSSQHNKFYCYQLQLHNRVMHLYPMKVCSIQLWSPLWTFWGKVLLHTCCWTVQPGNQCLYMDAGLLHFKNWSYDGSKSIFAVTLQDPCMPNSYLPQQTVASVRLASQRLGFYCRKH